MAWCLFLMLPIVRIFFIILAAIWIDTALELLIVVEFRHFVWVKGFLLIFVRGLPTAFSAKYRPILSVTTTSTAWCAPLTLRWILLLLSTTTAIAAIVFINDLFWRIKWWLHHTCCCCWFEICMQSLYFFQAERRFLWIKFLIKVRWDACATWVILDRIVLHGGPCHKRGVLHGGKGTLETITTNALLLLLICWIFLFAISSHI